MLVAIIIVLGVLAALVGVAVLAKRPPPCVATHEEFAKAIEDFLEATGGDHDWDDFLHWRIADPFLESVRKKCGDIYEEYPATEKGHYCSDEGTEVLRGLLKEVRAKASLAK
jgi:hypothetical protein